jgi:hypothetical protein
MYATQNKIYVILIKYNQGPTLHFGNVPHPWALLMAKHEARVSIAPLPFQHKLIFLLFLLNF